MNSTNPAPGPLRLRYSHEAMVDLLLSCPGISNNELAARFGYTPAWVSTILHSDAFQAKLAARRAELVDPALVLTLEERYRGVAGRAAEVLIEKLSAPSHMLEDGFVLQAATVATKALGMGNPAYVKPSKIETDSLADLAQRLRGLKRQVDQSEIIDITPNESGPSGN